MSRYKSRVLLTVGLGEELAMVADTWWQKEQKGKEGSCKEEQARHNSSKVAWLVSGKRNTLGNRLQVPNRSAFQSFPFK